jgi:hypothetical protein
MQSLVSEPEKRQARPPGGPEYSARLLRLELVLHSSADPARHKGVVLSRPTTNLIKCLSRKADRDQFGQLRTTAARLPVGAENVIRGLRPAL